LVILSRLQPAARIPLNKSFPKVIISPAVFRLSLCKEISAMTPRQIELVQHSFDQVVPILEPATNMFYDRLFQLDSSLRPMFRSPQAEQARKLAHVLTVVVKGLSRPQQILSAVEDLGRRHANYGVQPRHYATVGAALLWTLEMGLGEAFTAEVREAWSSAYQFLSSAMLRAAGDADTVEVFAVPRSA
jgi:hemoglobin-like flavoprotein